MNLKKLLLNLKSNLNMRNKKIKGWGIVCKGYNPPKLIKVELTEADAKCVPFIEDSCLRGNPRKLHKVIPVEIKLLSLNKRSEK